MFSGIHTEVVIITKKADRMGFQEKLVLCFVGFSEGIFSNVLNKELKCINLSGSEKNILKGHGKNVVIKSF